MCAARRSAKRGRPRQPVPRTLPDDLYDYDRDPVPVSRSRDRDTPLLGPNGQAMYVIDDWPEDVAVTEAEIEVFERWFGDVFDELFSPKHPEKSLLSLSHNDRKEL